MERRFVVETDELVSFAYDLAGAGTRFLALTVDTIVQVVSLIAVSLIGFSLVMMSAKFLVGFRSIQAILYALYIVAAFLIFFGYFIVFEIVWRGQTPGKRAFKIRVVRDGGQRCDAMTIIIRNLVRLVDAALAMYLVAGVIMLISPRNKRLGDYAAGTIVIRDQSSPAIPKG